MADVSPLPPSLSPQELDEGSSSEFTYGVAAMQGWRTEMVREERGGRRECVGRPSAEG